MLNFKNCNKAKTLYLDICFNTVYYRSIFISQSNKGPFFNYIDKTRWLGVKIYIFWEGHKILRNPHRYYVGQIYGGDFAKICSLLRIYELYWKCQQCADFSL